MTKYQIICIILSNSINIREIMAKLSCSIHASDFYNLGKNVEDAINFGVDWIHFDVMDGHFAPELSFGSKILKDLQKKIKWFYDVHLMVTNPEVQYKAFLSADLINFHLEAPIHGDRLVREIKDKGKLAGITLNPATPVSFLENYLPLVDLVLVMTVNPGFSGQKCIEANFKKIEFFKKQKELYNYKVLFVF